MAVGLHVGVLLNRDWKVAFSRRSDTSEIFHRSACCSHTSSVPLPFAGIYNYLMGSSLTPSLSHSASLEGKGIGCNERKKRGTAYKDSSPPISSEPIIRCGETYGITVYVRCQSALPTTYTECSTQWSRAKLNGRSGFRLEETLGPAGIGRGFSAGCRDMNTSSALRT